MQKHYKKVKKEKLDRQIDKSRTKVPIKKRYNSLRNVNSIYFFLLK